MTSSRLAFLCALLFLPVLGGPAGAADPPLPVIPNRTTNAVVNFGAIGNGTTDNAGSINAAITAVANLGGGTVVIEPGSTSLTEKGQFDQAIDDFTMALEIGSKGAGAYYYRGISYVNKGQFDWAIADFNKALEIDPKSAGFYYNRGIAYYFKKEYDKSWKDIRRAEDLGYKIPFKFLENLRNASKRQN